MANFLTIKIKASDRLLWRIIFAQLSMAQKVMIYEGVGVINHETEGK